MLLWGEARLSQDQALEEVSLEQFSARKGIELEHGFRLVFYVYRGSGVDVLAQSQPHLARKIIQAHLGRIIGPCHKQFRQKPASYSSTSPLR